MAGLDRILMSFLRKATVSIEHYVREDIFQCRGLSLYH